MGKVRLKCYVTAERSPGNYSVRNADFVIYWETYFVITFLGRKADNSEIRCFTFHISTKEMNMLVRLVRYLNFWCHFDWSTCSRWFSSEYLVIIAGCRLLMTAQSQLIFPRGLLFYVLFYYKSQVSHQAGAYPSFCSMKWLGVFLLPPGWDASPSQGTLPPALSLLVPIYISGWREALWE